MNIKHFLRAIEEYVTLILSFIVGWIRYRNQKINSSDIDKIAIIKLDHLGDVILSTPAIANVREYFPNAHIALVVNPSSKAIAEMIPYVDEVILYNARFFDRSGNARAFDILKGVRFAENMKQRKFDLIIDLRGSFATLLYAVISNSRYRLDRGAYLVKRKFGRKKSPFIPLLQRGNDDEHNLLQRGNDNEHEFLQKGSVEEHDLLKKGNVDEYKLLQGNIDKHDILQRKNINERDVKINGHLIQKRKGVYKGDEWSDLHEANVCLNILLEAGIPIKIKETSIDPKHVLQETDLSYNDVDMEMKVVIHAGAPLLLKRWSSQKYVDLIKTLLRDYPAKIFLIGGKDEYELSNKILEAVNDNRVINLTGKLTLAELAYLLKRSQLFIGNDSGPMHIASACGTKVIGLYGPTDPERFGPYGGNCIALRMEDKCPPCAKDECKFKNYRCVDQISVDDVINVIKDLLNIDQIK